MGSGISIDCEQGGFEWWVGTQLYIQGLARADRSEEPAAALRWLIWRRQGGDEGDYIARAASKAMQSRVGRGQIGLLLLFDHVRSYPSQTLRAHACNSQGIYVCIYGRFIYIQLPYTSRITTEKYIWFPIFIIAIFFFPNTAHIYYYYSLVHATNAQYINRESERINHGSLLATLRIRAVAGPGFEGWRGSSFPSPSLSLSFFLRTS